MWVLKNNLERGLIFVELLVVIALIGLLLTIVVTSIGEAKKQARDSLRLVHVQEVSKALALYNLKHQRFPVSKKVTALDENSVLKENLVDGGLITKLPFDPLHPEYNYYYVSNERGTKYILTYCLETEIFGDKLKGCGNTLTP
jgi:type II secretory pathway pseudopilin PulG